MRLIPCRATSSALIMVTSHDCDGSDGVTRLSDGLQRGRHAHDRLVRHARVEGESRLMCRDRVAAANSAALFEDRHDVGREGRCRDERVRRAAGWVDRRFEVGAA